MSVFDYNVRFLIFILQQIITPECLFLVLWKKTVDYSLNSLVRG
uniref:Uncharacterized protein n=1 Tax=Rhizophora mucronata TaxID=61149 RepID=A0A2P2PLV2_RHIMU